MSPTRLNWRASGPGQPPVRGGRKVAVLLGALICAAAAAALLGWSEIRLVIGNSIYFALLIAVWYVPVIAILKALGIGMDRVQRARPRPARAALWGALVGAAYGGVPTAVLFAAADAATNGRGMPSEFAQVMNGLARVLVLPASLGIGGIWAASSAARRASTRPMAWQLRILCAQPASEQEQIMQSILARHRRRGEALPLSADASGNAQLVAVSDPDLGEAILAELWSAGINGEVVDPRA